MHTVALLSGLAMKYQYIGGSVNSITGIAQLKTSYNFRNLLTGHNK